MGILEAPGGTAGLWKRLEGTISASGWTSPQSPNATYKTPGASKCAPYCLYRLDKDPGEHDDLADDESTKAIAAELGARIVAAQKTGFRPKRGSQDPASCITAIERYGGFWGPWIGLAEQAPSNSIDLVV